MSPHAHQPGDDWLPEVIGLLDEQRGNFRALDALGRQQTKCVGAGETERLLGVLAEKQKVVERVQGVNARLSPFMSDWQGRVASLPERSRVLLRSHTDELESLAREVHARDDADRAALESQSKVISDELATTARAKGAARAYGMPGGASVSGGGGGVGGFFGTGGIGGGAGSTGGSVAPRFQDRRG